METEFDYVNETDPRVRSIMRIRDLYKRKWFSYYFKWEFLMKKNRKLKRKVRELNLIIDDLNQQLRFQRRGSIGEGFTSESSSD